MSDHIETPALGSRRRRWGHAAALLTMVFVLGGVALLWAWNTIAVELFRAPAMAYRHALAAQLVAIALVALPLSVARLVPRAARE